MACPRYWDGSQEYPPKMLGWILGSAPQNSGMDPWIHSPKFWGEFWDLLPKILGRILDVAPLNVGMDLGISPKILG